MLAFVFSLGIFELLAIAGIILVLLSPLIVAGVILAVMLARSKKSKH